MMGIVTKIDNLASTYNQSHGAPLMSGKKAEGGSEGARSFEEHIRKATQESHHSRMMNTGLGASYGGRPMNANQFVASPVQQAKLAQMAYAKNQGIRTKSPS